MSAPDSTSGESRRLQQLAAKVLQTLKKGAIGLNCGMTKVRESQGISGFFLLGTA
jgi:hypothetical protein